MNLDTFFENFELFANAPRAVDKMRELVLELAVQGKLVEQDSNDEPVAKLVQTLNEKASRAMSGKRAQDRSTDDPSAESNGENTLTIPHHWAWVPLHQIGVLSGGMTPSKNKTKYWNGNVNWFSSKDIKSTELYESDLKITDTGLQETRLKLYAPGSLFIVARSGILKRTFPVSINRVAGTVNQDLKVLTPFLEGMERYLQIMLRGMTRFILKNLVKTGMTVQSLKYEEFAVHPFPLPPLAEQKRIVAKVDALMALCDRLEAQQRERDGRHADLARASVSRFNEDPTPDNLKLLFHPACPIDHADLRKTILTLAVRGKLVPQDSADEPVCKTFQEMDCLDKKSHEVGNIPGHWELTTYRNLTALVTSGSRGWKSYYSDSGAVFIRTQNIKTDRVVMDDVAYVSLPASTEGQRSKVEVGDILITITGANVTKAARVEHELEEAYISQHIALTRPRWKEMSPWLHQCFISPGSARGTLESLAYGDKPGLNLNHIRDLYLPVPPLAEQRRIVARVEELMGLVDQLEAQIAASRRTAVALLEAGVSALTNGE